MPCEASPQYSGRHPWQLFAHRLGILRFWIFDAPQPAALACPRASSPVNKSGAYISACHRSPQCASHSLLDCRLSARQPLPESDVLRAPELPAPDSADSTTCEAAGEMVFGTRFAFIAHTSARKCGRTLGAKSGLKQENLERASEQGQRNQRVIGRGGGDRKQYRLEFQGLRRNAGER